MIRPPKKDIQSVMGKQSPESEPGRQSPQTMRGRGAKFWGIPRELRSSGAIAANIINMTVAAVMESPISSSKSKLMHGLVLPKILVRCIVTIPREMCDRSMEI